MKKYKKPEIILIFILIALAFILYLPVFQGYFQHDEWEGFAYYLSGRENLLTLFKPYVTHYVPLAKLFYYLYFSVFGFNFFWHALSSIVAHLLVVYLCYLLFIKLLKNRTLAFLSALLFAIGASGHQATSWIGASINTHGSAIFGLLALVVLYQFNKIWLSIVFLIISLLFKETTIALFITLPLMIYIFDKKKFVTNWLGYTKITIVGILYFALRYSMIFIQRTSVADQLVTETQSLSNIVGNMITFPVKIFSQSLIPTGQLLSFAENISKILPPAITGLYGTTAFDIFTQGTALQILNWLIFLIFTLLLIYITKKLKNEPIKKTALFGFIFVILNSFIYTLSPGRSGNIPVVDSRNIYLPSIGAVVFLVSLIYLLLKEQTVKTFLIITIFVVLNTFWLEKELKFFANRGTERKEILYQIKEVYPTLPKKVIFYLVSDKPFYGLPESETIFPFETNLGYIIMVLYQPTEHFPKEFIGRTDFLYGSMTKEGYLETGGRGFGYFRNWNMLIRAVKDNNLKEDSVISFSYHGYKLIEDITPRVRKEIKDAIGKN